jgi:hypothetical protein
MPLRHRLPLHPRLPLHLLTRPRPPNPTGEQPSHRSVTDIATREQLLARARRLGVFTVAWDAIEGFVAISAAWIAGSRALAAFGLDGAIESVSASCCSGALARSAAIPTAPNTWSTSLPERSGRASCCWADPIAGLGVVALLVHEGREALNAEHIDDCC